MTSRLVFWTALSCTAVSACYSQESERISTTEAMAQLSTLACSKVFATDADKVAACKEEYFSTVSSDPHALFRDDSQEEEKACMEAGGVLVERMPACADAMATLIRDTDEDKEVGVSGFFSSLGDLTTHCGAASLCEASGSDFL